MSIDAKGRRQLWLAAVIVVSVVASVGPTASGTGQSFRFLRSPLTQDLFGVTDPLPGTNILGGVAFAPNSDVWSTDCQFWETTLRRFDRSNTLGINGSSVHPISAVVDLTSTGPYSALFPSGIG